jgi:hypothetical protein
VSADQIAGHVVATHQVEDSYTDGTLGCTECGWRGRSLDDFGAHVVADLAAARVICVQLPEPDKTGNYLPGYGRTRVWITAYPGEPGRVADGSSPVSFSVHRIAHLDAFVGALLAAKADIVAGAEATEWPD